MREIKLDKIRLDGGTQVRVALSQDTISDYAQVYIDGGELPAVEVFYDGSNYWLADGFHRWHAARAAGREKIACTVHTGSVRDAMLAAAAANATHGLRRTNADKRHAVEMLLRDRVCVAWSDRRIADACAVSPELVGTVRRQLSESDSCEPARREGKDGRVRAVPERPARAEELPDEEPEDGTEVDPEEAAEPAETSAAVEDQRGAGHWLRVRLEWVRCKWVATYGREATQELAAAILENAAADYRAQTPDQWSDTSPGEVSP